MRFPAKENTCCPKALREFLPRKDGILHTPSGCLETPLSLRQSLYGRTYADITTKISCVDGLPNFLTSGVPRCVSLVDSPLSSRHARSRWRVRDLFDYAVGIHRGQKSRTLKVGRHKGSCSMDMSKRHVAATKILCSTH